MIKTNVTRTRLIAMALTTGASVLSAVSSAHAGAFAINEQSTVGTGMAYAGVAAGGTLSDQFWNPATLGDVHGLQTETDLTAILPYVNVNTNPFGPFPAQRDGNVGINALVPASNYAYRLNQNIILGLGINSPFDLATSYPGSAFVNSNIANLGIAGTSRIFSIDVNPNIAYQFNEQLTIAVGLQAQYMEARETSFLQPTGILSGSTHNLGWGYTLGIDYKPMKGTSIGLGYRSGIDNTINGSITGLTAGGVPIPGQAGDLKLKTPGIATLGVSQDVGDYWTVKGGVQYTNWATLGTAPLSGAAGAVVQGAIGTAGIPFNYKDAWMFSTGAEYKFRPDTTLRAGIGYETSPIDNANRSFRLPDADRLWLSAGASYAFSKTVSVDFGYSFLHAFGSQINSGTSGTGPIINGPFSGSFNGNVHIVSMALKMKFD